MNRAWALTVWPASAVMTWPARGSTRPGRAAGREPGDLVRLRAGQVLGQHGSRAVRGGGLQVRDQPVFACRAAHGLPVDGDGGQRGQPGQRERDRAGVRAGGQVGAGLPGDALGAQRGQHPDHGVGCGR